MLAGRLWAMFADEDATLTEDGAVLAVDGKVTLDDNAAFRHEHARFDDVSSTDPIEARAQEKHLNYGSGGTSGARHGVGGRRGGAMVASVRHPGAPRAPIGGW